MRFVGVLIGGEAVEKFTVIPPCAGYYTDISIQIQYYAYDVDKPKNFIYFGTSKLDTSFTALLKQSTVTVLPDYKPSNGIFQPVRAKSTHLLVAHRGKERIYVSEGEKLTFMHVDYYAAASPDSVILIQGSFIPNEGAIFKQLIELGAVSISDDWISVNRYKFPLGLQNSQIKATMYGSLAAAPVGVELYFRKNKSREDQFVDTVADAAGDILDTDFIDQDNISGSGIIGSLSMEMNALQPENKETEVITFGNAWRGDFLSWDMKLVSGAIGASVYKLSLIVAGIVPKQTWTEEGMFIVNEFVQYIDREGEVVDKVV